AAQVIRALAAEGYLGIEALEALDATPVEWLDPLPDEAGLVESPVTGDVARAATRTSDRSDAG
ncbi:MAG TPA: hypothetical protein DCG14_09570, partial [Phycisphaerales bacterium]|nr:hypothetical protein [Phycisphaerales bacterium]